MDVFKKFSERLSELMFDAQNMTAKQLAEIAGVSGRTVERWRSGSVLISYDNLQKVADYFRCSFDFLLGRRTVKLDFTIKPCLSFYDRLREVMNENGVSWYKLVLETELTDAHLHQWKKGAVPKVPALIALADYLDCTIDYLVGRER